MVPSLILPERCGHVADRSGFLARTLMAVFAFSVGAGPVFATGRCCLPSGNCINTDEATCQSRGGIFAGNGTACPPSGQCGNGFGNDNCVDATVITEGTFAFDTNLATPDGTSSCGLSNASPDVRFAYSPTGTGTASVQTCGLAGYDSVLGAFASCGGPELGCNDDACALQSRIDFPVAPGMMYLIRVAGYNGASGAGSIMVSRAPAQSACPCDWNQNGIVNSQDLFDFLGSFFAGQADFNQNGVTDSQDFFDFVTCFLDPPPSCGQCASFVNIRTLVDGSADDPPNIQANYDSLNRLLYLCGDLTLAQVLTSPFGQLVPGIAQRLPNVQGCTGAATNVGAVQAALNNAAAVSGGIPIGQLLTIRQGTNPPIELAFAQLRSAGVPFPEFSLNQQQSDARAATLPNVIANAGDLRVADLAYRSRSSFTPMENQALDEVHLSGLFYLASCRNDRCCCSQGFLCVASVGSFCSRSLDGPCSWDSSTCPDPQPIQCRH